MEASERICQHDLHLHCGCWIDKEGRVRRHAFRFLKGDKVRHSFWKGFTGTVEDNGACGIYVVWDRLPGIGDATPPAFQDSWNITHIEEELTEAG